MVIENKKILKEERNKKIVSMRKSHYPLLYIAKIFNISESQVSRISKKYASSSLVGDGK